MECNGIPYQGQVMKIWYKTIKLKWITSEIRMSCLYCPKTVHLGCFRYKFKRWQLGLEVVASLVTLLILQAVAPWSSSFRFCADLLPHLHLLRTFSGLEGSVTRKRGKSSLTIRSPYGNGINSKYPCTEPFVKWISPWDMMHFLNVRVVLFLPSLHVYSLLVFSTNIYYYFVIRIWKRWLFFLMLQNN